MLRQCFSQVTGDELPPYLAVHTVIVTMHVMQASLKLCREARLDTLRAWIAAKLSDENLSDGEV